MIEIHCCPPSPFTGPEPAARNNLGLKDVTSTGLSWPIKLISLFHVPRSMITTVLTGPFIAFAAAM
jgi:hypothetical protein